MCQRLISMILRSRSHSKNIKIDDKVAMEMGYPSLDQFIKNNFLTSLVRIQSNLLNQLQHVLEQILTEEETWVVRDSVPKKEVIELLWIK